MIKWKVISFSYYDIIMSFFLIQKYFKATLVFHLFRFSQRMRKKWNKEISVSYSIWQQDGASSHTANPVNGSSGIFWELILTLKAHRRSEFFTAVFLDTLYILLWCVPPNALFFFCAVSFTCHPFFAPSLLHAVFFTCHFENHALLYELCWNLQKLIKTQI